MTNPLPDSPANNGSAAKNPTVNDPARVLAFGGTCETHELARLLIELQVDVTMSVASDYGRALLPPDSKNFHVLWGPMLPNQIEERLSTGAYSCVIDATHPYATSISAHVAQAAHKTGVPYLRLLRDPSDLTGCTVVESCAQAAKLLASTSGNVLLTTGVKDLNDFARMPGYSERLFPRVLPTVSSITRCLDLGYKVSHIIAMQGPFSYELNVALMQQLHIAAMVTKDGGRQGGFGEKVQAAHDCGARVIVVSRPADQPGMDMNELLRRVAGYVK